MDTNNFNPWYASQNGAYQTPPPPQQIGGIGFTNSQYNNMNNGGYYTNMYNNYYNPYYMQQQREKEAEEARKKEIGRMMFQERLADNYYAYKNVERTETMTVEEQYELQQKEFYYKQKIQSMYQEYDNFNTDDFYFDGGEFIPQQNEPVDFGEFIAGLGVRCVQIQEEKARKERMNLTRAYDRNQYASMVNGYNNSDSNIVDAFSRDFTIDDMEITLPSQMSTQYEEKRKRFLEAIFSKD